jgi:hypothetical protein
MSGLPKLIESIRTIQKLGADSDEAKAIVTAYKAHGSDAHREVIDAAIADAKALKGNENAKAK